MNELENERLVTDPAPGTKNLWQALGEENDPEFPMSILDIGLVYGLERRGEAVVIQITFTAMGCPAMDMILGDIRDRLRREPGVTSVEFDIVWDPPWTKERLSARGRLLMQTWGIAV